MISRIALSAIALCVLGVVFIQFAFALDSQNCGLAAVYLDADGRRLNTEFGQINPRILTTSADRGSTFNLVAENNMCASLLLANQFKSARRSCNRALRYAAADAWSCDVDSQCSNKPAALAVVHSNRGVVFALMDAPMQAKGSFTKALRLDPKQDAALHNLSVLNSPCSVADVVAIE